MDIDEFANTGAISYRIFLEKSIKLFLKYNKINKIPCSPPKHRRRTNIVSVGEAQLSDLLDYLCKKDVMLISDNNVKKNLRKFRNNAAFPSLSTLNTMIHNEEDFFTGEQARNLWPSLERLFIIMLSETGDESRGQLQKPFKVSGRKEKPV
jgi:inhibitor of KinA sporulation pathway (predicted exonuclease)